MKSTEKIHLGMTHSHFLQPSAGEDPADAIPARHGEAEDRPLADGGASWEILGWTPGRKKSHEKRLSLW